MGGRNRDPHVPVDNLELFHIIRHSFLYDNNPERRQFVVKDDHNQTTLFEIIQEYVVNGRKYFDLRHPCLLPDDRNDISSPSKYLREAQKICNATEAEAFVYEMPDIYIEFAVTKYTHHRRASTHLRLEGDQVEYALILTYKI